MRSRLQLIAAHDGCPAARLEVRNADEGGVIADIVLPASMDTLSQGKA